ncbi:MAG: hypothetical protein ABIF40_04850 [archaeon]
MEKHYLLLNTAAHKAATGSLGLLKELDQDRVFGSFEELLNYTVNEKYKGDEADIASEVLSYLDQQDGKNVILEINVKGNKANLDEKVKSYFIEKEEDYVLDVELSLRSRVG